MRQGFLTRGAGALMSQTRRWIKLKSGAMIATARKSTTPLPFYVAPFPDEAVGSCPFGRLSFASSSNFKFSEPA